MSEFRTVRKFDAAGYLKAARILNRCGKDMAEKEDLHHWDNPMIKSFAIVLLCAASNDVYILYEHRKAVATFQIRKRGTDLYFEKLAVIPEASGKGLGSLCMKKIEETAGDSGCRTITLEVYEKSRRAVLFYEHKGYEAAGKVHTKKHTLIVMRKVL